MLNPRKNLKLQQLFLTILSAITSLNIYWTWAKQILNRLFVTFPMSGFLKKISTRKFILTCLFQTGKSWRKKKISTLFNSSPIFLKNKTKEKNIRMSSCKQIADQLEIIIENYGTTWESTTNYGHILDLNASRTLSSTNHYTHMKNIKIVLFSSTR